MRFVVGLWAVHTGGETFTKVDMDQRITELFSAVQALQAQVDRFSFPHSQTVRGIFIAPEYFLANKQADFLLPRVKNAPWQSVERTISDQERDACVQRIRKLSKKYPHILIVPGTIAWKKTFDRDLQDGFSRDPLTYKRSDTPKGNVTDRRDRAIGELQYFINLDSKFNRMQNLQDLTKSRLRPTTDNRGEEIDFTRPSNVSKISSIVNSFSNSIKYYMRNTAFVYLNGQIPYKYHKKGDYFESVNTSETVFVPSHKSPLKQIDVSDTEQAVFGFEICLDHGLDSLKNFMRMGQRTSDEGFGEIDLHVVSSAAVPNNAKSMCMRDGGFFLHASSNPSYTAVFENVAGEKVAVEPYLKRQVCNHPLQFSVIALLPPDERKYLREAVKMLQTYDDKSWVRSSASKNAVAIIQKLVANRDVEALRQHVGWYTGASQQKPLNAGNTLKTDGLLHKLLLGLGN